MFEIKLKQKPRHQKPQYLSLWTYVIHEKYLLIHQSHIDFNWLITTEFKKQLKFNDQISNWISIWIQACINVKKTIISHLSIFFWDTDIATILKFLP